MCSLLRVPQAEPTEAWKVPAAAAGLAGHGAELTAACQGVPGASPLSSVLNEPRLLGPEGLCPCNLCVPMSGPRRAQWAAFCLSLETNDATAEHHRTQHLRVKSGTREALPHCSSLPSQSAHPAVSGGDMWEGSCPAGFEARADHRHQQVTPSSAWQKSSS